MRIKLCYSAKQQPLDYLSIDGFGEAMDILASLQSQGIVCEKMDITPCHWRVGSRTNRREKARER